MVGPYKGIRHYKEVGEASMKVFVDLASLKPNEDVLDIGCGCGQMAVPLTKYLEPHSIYEGFDINEGLIEWDTKRISSKYPNFHFQLADVFSEPYNPKGKYEASNYRFPYEDESFDFVFLKSVFTHMLSKAIQNYLSEVARVLRKNGRCLITYFLINEESLGLINEGLSDIDPKYGHKDYRTIDEKTPENAVAYDESYVRRSYETRELSIIEPIHYGSWCGRRASIGGQDIIVARKK
jgi:ubiquinone/menaquinone biosynthesis C-methylase UbiE